MELLEKPTRGLTSPSEIIKQIPRKIADYPGLIFLGFRGSVAHGMYVPNTDPNSIDDIDLVGVYIGDLRHYFGFGNAKTVEIKEEPWDVVLYEFKHYVWLLYKGNPNMLSTLWMDDEHRILSEARFLQVLKNRDLFVSKKPFNAFYGYAQGQRHRMGHPNKEGYLGAKRKALIEKYGYDIKNAAHCIRLLRMCVEFMRDGVLYVNRSYIDAGELLEIKQGK